MVYAVAALLAAVVTTGLLCAVLRRIGLPPRVFGVCVAVFVLNPYSLRYYGLAPGELADLLLDAAVLLTIVGLLDQRYPLVLVGVAAGTLCRQTMLPVAVVVALWLLADPAWRDRSPRRRRLLAGTALVVCAALYALVVVISAPFSAQTTPDVVHLTLLADLEALPRGVGELGQHFLRCANDLFSVGAAILVAALAGRRSPRTEPLPFAFWGCLLLAAAIIAQPVLFSPQYAAHNETRLAVMGLGALVCCLAYLLRSATWITPPLSALTVVLLALGSFHHLYTILRTTNARQTVELQLLVAVILAAVLGIAARHGTPDGPG